MLSFEFSNAPDLDYWQGIRYLSDNYYIICGTNKSDQGIFYIGDVLNYNSNNNYTLNFPGANTTSLYGPNYKGNATYQLVGSYQNMDDNNIYGLFYEGTLSDFNNQNNYKTIELGYSYTFVHSIMENILVGNYNISDISPINAFLMTIDTGKVINIRYPNSKSNTVYGVWYNGDSTYTLCGGYSYLEVFKQEIYIGPIIKPFGYTYLVNYNIKTNQFSNWTTIYYPYNNYNLLSHFQGISSNSPGKYQLAADTIKLGKIITSFVEVKFDQNSKFYLNKWIDFKYPLPGIIESSSNSVAQNCIVGTYLDETDKTTAFQLKIEL
jgi:hypothetical protein